MRSSRGGAPACPSRVWGAWRALTAERTPKSGVVPRKGTQSGGASCLRRRGRRCRRAHARRHRARSASQSHTACPTFVTPRPALSAPRASTPPHDSSAQGTDAAIANAAVHGVAAAHKPLACAALRIARLCTSRGSHRARRSDALRPLLPRNPAVRCRGFRVEPAAHTSSQPHPSLFPRRRAGRFAPSLCVSSPKTPDLTRHPPRAGPAMLSMLNAGRPRPPRPRAPRSCSCSACTTRARRWCPT